VFDLSTEGGRVAARAERPRDVASVNSIAHVPARLPAPGGCSSVVASSTATVWSSVGRRRTRPVGSRSMPTHSTC
jgi:hypothetical protein